MRFTKDTFNASLLTEIEIDFDPRDYPDYCDAYIVDCLYDGEELTDEEIDWLNDNHSDIAQEQALNR